MRSEEIEGKIKEFDLRSEEIKGEIKEVFDQEVVESEIGID